MDVTELAGLHAVAALSPLVTDSAPDQGTVREVVARLSHGGRGLTVVICILDERGAPWMIVGGTAEAEELAASQFSLDEGPCIDSARGDATVWARTATAQRRWPRWGPRLISAGVEAVVSIPVADGAHHLGSVWVALESPDWVDDDELGMASTVAIATVRHVALHRENARLREKVAQLERALGTRVRIEQAKGMLAARWGLDVDSAFQRLRRYARSRQLRLQDVAERVVAEGFVPDDEVADPVREAGAAADGPARSSPPPPPAHG